MFDSHGRVAGYVAEVNHIADCNYANQVHLIRTKFLVLAYQITHCSACNQIMTVVIATRLEEVVESMGFYLKCS